MPGEEGLLAHLLRLRHSQRCAEVINIAFALSIHHALHRLATIESRTASEGQVAIKILAAPVTAEDVKIVMPHYFSLYHESFIPQVTGLSLLAKGAGATGSYAVGKVTSIGPNVSSVKANDKVFIASRGVFSEEVSVDMNDVIPLTTSKTAEEMAAIPALLTAWALLHEFKSLKSNDVVVQTNGNTAVGLAVSQIAKVKGISVVNVTEKSLTDFKPSGEVALCLCNASAMSRPLLKLLAPDGAFVAYSDTVEPLPSIHSVDVPVTAAIFKKVKVAGFHLMTWKEIEPAKFKNAVAEVASMIESGKVNISSKKYKLSDYVNAMSESSTGSLVVFSI